MSALGQKQTCALQNVMSALHPIATAKANSAKGHVRFTPKSGHVRCNEACRFGPIADIAIYSITSSAATKRGGEIVKPSAFAVRRLTAVLKNTGACTGRSAGAAPFRMRST